MTGWAPGAVAPAALGFDLPAPQPVTPGTPDRNATERLLAPPADREREGTVEARFWSRRGFLEEEAVAVRESPPEPVADPTFRPPAESGRAVPSPPGVGRSAVEAAFAGSPGLEWALRVARCESNFNPGAYNASSGASGLFQFLASTWHTTPYAGASAFDASANAQAARWMYERGRAGEWTCR